MNDIHLNNANTMFLVFAWKLKKVYEDSFIELGQAFDLTKNEMEVLLFLKNNHPLNSAGDIAKYKSMSKSMISKSVDNLYQRGYLSYEVDENDKRRIQLKITLKAEQMVAKLVSVQKRFFDYLTKDISDKDKDVMASVLKQMYENILIIDEADRRLNDGNSGK